MRRQLSQVRFHALDTAVSAFALRRAMPTNPGTAERDAGGCAGPKGVPAAPAFPREAVDATDPLGTVTQDE